MRLSIFAFAAAFFALGPGQVVGLDAGRLRRRPPDSEHRRVVVRQAAVSSNGVAAVGDAAPTNVVKVSLPFAPATAPSTAPSPAPTPLDTSISLALSQKCLYYLSNLIASPEFTACLPFSLLLSSSNGYKSEVATATKISDYTYLNDLLAYVNSPQPSSEKCDQLFASYLPQFQDDANCGKDVAQRVPTARQARRGIGNYAVMREAAGIVNPSTGVYCYLEAIASPRPDDLYLWMMPSGNILPASSSPTCSDCSALLMNHYGSWSSNTTTLNSTTLSTAASAINTKCGASFISVTATPDHTLASQGHSHGPLKNNIFRLSLAPVIAWAFLSYLD